MCFSDSLSLHKQIYKVDDMFLLKTWVRKITKRYYTLSDVLSNNSVLLKPSTIRVSTRFSVFLVSNNTGKMSTSLVPSLLPECRSVPVSVLRQGLNILGIDTTKVMDEDYVSH